MTCKEMLVEAMKLRNEKLSDIISTTLTDEQMNQSSVPCFTAWTKDTVYFPAIYDHEQWVGSVSRNPDGKPTDWQGH